MDNVNIFPDADSLAKAAADHFAGCAQEAIALRGHFSVALSGGSTPKKVYKILAENFSTALEWKHIHLFWGDERCVPPDHPDSNFRMVRESLLNHVSIAAANIHRIRGEAQSELAAQEYEDSLRTFFAIQPETDSESNAQPQTFDLVLLGLGEDGHTASLFPGSPALDVKDRWVIAVEHNEPPPPMVTRISLTIPTINAARQVSFIVSGAQKEKRLKQVFKSQHADQTALPAQQVNPTSRNLLWFVDRAAMH